jgi:hypothetical protein
MKTARKSATVRRSIALPRLLIEQVTAVAPAPLRQNFNRLVSTALLEFAEARRAETFARSMRTMAADPKIRAECASIEREFARFESDGLPSD